MLGVKARCDNPNCKCGENGNPKEKAICGSGVVPEHKAVMSLLKQTHWVVGEYTQHCSYHCQEDHQMNCNHNNNPEWVIKKDEYSICVKCGEIWQPNYDSMREGK